LAAEGSEDGYDDLGITSALDCYKKASEYANKVIAAGYSPVTEISVARFYDRIQHGKSGVGMVL